MALLHDATLIPTKRELLNAWLPRQSWWPGGEFEHLGAYRLDDPDGEVGLECFVLGASDGTVVHVPVTYRGAPLEGADEHLIGTTEHSVLGSRWVYDGVADPVLTATMTTTILTGGRQADLELESDGKRQPRPSSATVRGSGVGSGPAPGVELTVVRRVGDEIEADETLVGQWRDGGGPAVLAGVRRT
jgi:hypothetical protein